MTVCQYYTPGHVLKGPARLPQFSFSLKLESFALLHVCMRRSEHPGEANMAPALLQKQQKPAENPGQWVPPRHRHVSSIYTFNYSFSFSPAGIFCIPKFTLKKKRLKQPRRLPLTSIAGSCYEPQETGPAPGPRWSRTRLQPGRRDHGVETSRSWSGVSSSLWQRLRGTKSLNSQHNSASCRAGGEMSRLVVSGDDPEIRSFRTPTRATMCTFFSGPAPQMLRSCSATFLREPGTDKHAR